MSAIYKVPFQNLTGDEGFYVYQQVYPIYGLAIVFSFSGVPLFISKVISQEETVIKKRTMLNELFTGLGLLGISMWGILQLFSSQIAGLMGDPNLSLIIKSVSYFYLVLPFISLLRGMFQGEGHMLPTGVSQILEQLTRISIILFIAVSFVNSNWSIYTMGSYAMTSTVISGIIAIIVLVVYLNYYRYKLADLLKLKWPSRSLIKRFLTEGIEIILLSSLMVIFQFIDSFTVFNGLVNSGILHPEAMVLKGVYDRGQPFVQLGLTVALAISTSLLPALSHYYKQNDIKRWRLEATSTLRLTIVMASATTIGLISVMPWLNIALFQDANDYHVLQVYALSVFFVSVSLCIQAILQSTTEKNRTTLVILGVGLLKMVMNFFGVTWFGTLGSSLITVLSVLVLSICMAKQLPKSVKDTLFTQAELFKVVLANSILLFIVTAVREALPEPTRLIALVGVLGLAAMGVLVYGVLVIKWGLLSAHELNQLPFSKVLKKVGLVSE